MANECDFSYVFIIFMRMMMVLRAWLNVGGDFNVATLAVRVACSHHFMIQLKFFSLVVVVISFYFILLFFLNFSVMLFVFCHTLLLPKLRSTQIIILCGKFTCVQNVRNLFEQHILKKRC